MMHRLWMKLQDKKIDSELEEIETGQPVLAPEYIARKIRICIKILSVILCVFQIYTGLHYPLQPMNQRTFHLMIVLLLVFFIDINKQKMRSGRIINYIFLLAVISFSIYILVNWSEFPSRIALLNALDLFQGTLAIICVLYAACKVVSPWMTAVAGVFLLYCYFGQYLHGMFRVPRTSYIRLIGYTTLGTEGIFGICLGSAATVIFAYILYTTFLIQLGAGEYVVGLARGIFGHYRGGFAKVAIIASALFGSISGNSSSNVVMTGMLTIPSMRKHGYSPEFAAAVESAASSGGVLMPPVMGAVAFIMADYLNISYAQVCVIAIIPALLYYTGIFISVDLYSKKEEIQTDEKIPTRECAVEFLKGWNYLASFATLLIAHIGFDRSALKSAFFGIISLIVATLIKKKIQRQKIEWRKLVDIFEQAARSTLIVSIASACAGLIIGILMTTGIIFRISDIMIVLSHNSVWVLLILTMISAIIFSMGRPVSVSYMMLAMLFAPAITSLGVPLVSAHLFILYFCVMSSVTPPMGISNYLASGIAGSKPWKTGVTAWKLTLSGYIIPFVLAYNPALILQGKISECAILIFTCFMGIIAISISLEGFCFLECSILERILFSVSAVLMIIPEQYTDIMGICMFMCGIGYQLVQKKKILNIR